MANSALAALAPLDSNSLSQRVERALMDLIAREGITEGKRLPTELELAAQLGVSRATVREAIARLRADGVVSTKPGRGAVLESRVPHTFRLSELNDEHSVAHLYELRRLIEIEAAGLAAARRSSQALAAMENAFEEMASAARAHKRAPHADVSFHRAIAMGTGNPHLIGLVDFIAGQLDRWIEKSWENSAKVAGGPHLAQAEHEVILDAIRRQDPRAAKRAARDHLRASQARLMGPVTANK